MAEDARYTDEYFGIIRDLGGDPEGRKHAYAYMVDSTAIVHHEVVASTFVPRLFCRKAYETLKSASEMTHRILCKVMQRYLDDEQYRDLFDFDERLKELILLPRGYDALLPFARIDTFMDENDYAIRFCEFNGDGSAGMNENREITNSILGTPTLNAFMKNHKVQGCALFQPWVDEFISIYGTFVNRREDPTFAVCDYLDHGVVDEFEQFARLFREAGYNCLVRDVRDLVFEDGELRDSDGQRIDAIWRRCVTNDVIEFWDESQALIEAVKAQAVALIGSFAGHIIHDKQVFDVLLEPATCEMLDAEEIAFLEQAIPQTDFLDDAHVDIAQIRANKDEWIIKPVDHYGADEVYAGCEVSQADWDALLGKYANSAAGYPFLVQRYIKPFKTKTLPPDKGILETPDDQVTVDPAMYNNLNGLYLFNGKFEGVFSRLGPHPTISKQNEGMTAATLWVDADVEGGLDL